MERPGRTPESFGIWDLPRGVVTAGAAVGYRRLPARPQQDDNDRHLPGHLWDHLDALCEGRPRLDPYVSINLNQAHSSLYV